MMKRSTFSAIRTQYILSVRRTELGVNCSISRLEMDYEKAGCCLQEASVWIEAKSGIERMQATFDSRPRCAISEDNVLRNKMLLIEQRYAIKMPCALTYSASRLSISS